MTWLFGGPPRAGDWIKTTEKIPVSLTDTLTNGGIPPGTRGVVTEVTGFFGGRLVAKVDGGLFGPMTVRMQASQVRVTRRGGGVEAYKQAAGRRGAIRAGAAIAMLGPLLFFSVKYLATGGSPDGLLAMLINGALYSALELLEYLLTNPVHALIYCAIVWLVGRVAFGRW